MEYILVMACVTILMMVLAFLTLTREDREILQEQLALNDEAELKAASATIPQRQIYFRSKS